MRVGRVCVPVLFYDVFAGRSQRFGRSRTVDAGVMRWLDAILVAVCAGLLVLPRTIEGKRVAFFFTSDGIATSRRMAMCDVTVNSDSVLAFYQRRDDFLAIVSSNVSCDRVYVYRRLLL